MKTIQLTAIAVAAGVSTTDAQTAWKLDPMHSQVTFSVTHMVISEVAGNFKKFDAEISTKGEDYSDAAIAFNIDVNSINTNSDMRDNHLKSDDFFNSEKFPQIKFKASSMKKTAGNKYELKGMMTIRDITKPVVFDVVYGGTVVDPYGNTRSGFKVDGSINRFDYGLKWNSMIEAGGAVVGDIVSFSANLELTKVK